MVQSYLTWQDLVEEEGRDTPEVKQPFAAPDRSPAREVRLPEEVTELLQQKEQLEHRLKVMAGEEPPGEMDERQARCFPVLEHTPETRMEARRLNRRLEQQRLKKIRSLAQKTLDRRAEAKAHDKREENAREVLKRERIERECLDKRIERRQVLKKKRRIGTLIFRNWSERRSEETRAIAWEKLKRKRSAETAHKIRGQKAAARKQRENKESRREESLRSAQAEQRKRERMALHADHRRRSKQWEQRHEKKCAEHKPKLQQKRRRADRPVNRPAPTETGKKDPDRYRIMALKRKKEQAREEQAEMARWEQLRQQKAERREQEKRLANKDPRTEKHSTDEERPKKITSWEQKSAKDLRREELAWVRRREMQREQMKHKTLERRKEALALEKRMDRRKAID